MITDAQLSTIFNISESRIMVSSEGQRELTGRNLVDDRAIFGIQVHHWRQGPQKENNSVLLPKTVHQKIKNKTNKISKKRPQEDRERSNECYLLRVLCARILERHEKLHVH